MQSVLFRHSPQIALCAPFLRQSHLDLVTFFPVSERIAPSFPVSERTRIAPDLDQCSLQVYMVSCMVACLHVQVQASKTDLLVAYTGSDATTSLLFEALTSPRRGGCHREAPRAGAAGDTDTHTAARHARAWVTPNLL